MLEHRPMQDDPVRLVSAAGIDPEALRAFARQNAPRLERYFPSTHRAGESLEASRAWVSLHMSREQELQAFVFALVPLDDVEIAGLVFLNGLCPDAGVAEAAGVIGAQWEGKGLMQDGMRRVFRWARDELGLRRVRLLIGDRNDRSLRLAEVLGFRRESREGRLFRKGTAWEEVQEYHCLPLK